MAKWAAVALGGLCLVGAGVGMWYVLRKHDVIPVVVDDVFDTMPEANYRPPLADVIRGPETDTDTSDLCNQYCLDLPPDAQGNTCRATLYDPSLKHCSVLLSPIVGVTYVAPNSDKNILSVRRNKDDGTLEAMPPNGGTKCTCGVARWDRACTQGKCLEGVRSITCANGSRCEYDTFVGLSAAIRG